jgi:hypothetical protein
MRLEALLIISLLMGTAAPASAQRAKAAREPAVVELFTAQGCSDCPQANALLMQLAENPDVIALTFSVDYWDYLGWRDTFARPEFAERQRAYRAAMKLRDVYTPQIFIDGTRQLSANKHEQVEVAVQQAIETHGFPPQMAFRGPSRIAIGSGRIPRGGAQVWLVRYAAEPIEIEVKKGDNRGQTVRHGNLVRQLVKLGDWRGAPKVLRLPKANHPDMETVVLVQATRSGRILGAARL